MNWKRLWDKHRIRVSQLGGLVLFLYAKPRSNALFLWGMAMIAGGEFIRVWAAGHIRKGKALAHQGPYAMVRHPLYVGSFLLATGFALICSSKAYWLSSLLIWAAVLTTFRWLYSVKIRMEEKDLELQFPRQFRQYRASVPAIFPSPLLLPQALSTSAFQLKQALKNKEHRTIFALLGLLLLLRVKMVYGL